MRRNHYVPIFVLRNFSSILEFKISKESLERIKNKNQRSSIFVYNVVNKELSKKRIENAFYKEDLYTDEIEGLFNSKMESQFSYLLNNKILKQGKIKELSKDEVLLLKKYCIISTIRACNYDEFSSVRGFYDVTDDNIKKNYIGNKKMIETMKVQTSDATQEQLLEAVKDNMLKVKPFDEYEKCTNKEYWEHSMKVILETDGTPDGVKKYKNPTHGAYFWALTIESSFPTFWEAKKNTDFVISDAGMTSENEINWNEQNDPFNRIKKENLYRAIAIDIKRSKVNEENYDKFLERELEIYTFHQNFMLFPVSNKLAIVLVSNYFKEYYENKSLQKIQGSFSKITKMKGNDIFIPPNETVYSFKFETKLLNQNDTLYCNVLLLDRIIENVGFKSLTDISASVLKHHKLTSNSKYARVKYTKLLEKIQNIDKNS